MTAPEDVEDLLRFTPGTTEPDLSGWATDSTPGVTARSAAEEATAALGLELAGLQDRLYAQARAGDPRRVLLVLQGTDTSGKDGTVRHALGPVNPAGLTITSFGRPTPEELSHDFLWRVRRALPEAGQIGVFNRSHYEDVLIGRVRGLVPEAEWQARYGRIQEFEQGLVDDGVTLVKVFLHLGHAEQTERLLARLEDPEKHWKMNPGDLDERELWPQYQQAYAAALHRCSGVDWFVVPADRKWYRNHAVTCLLVSALRRLDPQYPTVDLDVPALRARLTGD